MYTPGVLDAIAAAAYDMVFVDSSIDYMCESLSKNYPNTQFYVATIGARGGAAPLYHNINYYFPREYQVNYLTGELRRLCVIPTAHHHI